jgi:hypothetical protein
MAAPPKPRQDVTRLPRTLGLNRGLASPDGSDRHETPRTEELATGWSTGQRDQAVPGREAPERRSRPGTSARQDAGSYLLTGGGPSPEELPTGSRKSNSPTIPEGGDSVPCSGSAVTL